jgi:hypothetical protein
MQSFRLNMALTVLAALALAACTADPVNRSPRNVALIMSGDVVAYSAPGFGPRVSVVDVDGKPVKEPRGPVELTPGRHTVNLECDGANAPHTLTVAAGEIYQFAARTKPGARGCTGTLSRVRTANP